jgi:hypothetical protein
MFNNISPYAVGKAIKCFVNKSLQQGVAGLDLLIA